MKTLSRDVNVKRMDYQDFLASMGAKDRANIEKHLQICDAESEPGHAALWRKMATTLAGLAPHAFQTTGQRCVQFFVADGKYRRQVFALEDARDGKLQIYLDDVLDKSFSGGLLGKPKKGDEAATPEYPIKGAAPQTLPIDSLDSANTTDPPSFYKHMLGWNRKALRINLPVKATAPQVAVAQAMVALAAKVWEK